MGTTIRTGTKENPIVKVMTTASDSVDDNRQMCDFFLDIKSAFAFFIAHWPTPLKRQMENIPITVQKTAIAIEIALFDACLLYLKGYLTASHEVVERNQYNIES